MTTNKTKSLNTNTAQVVEYSRNKELDRLENLAEFHRQERNERANKIFEEIQKSTLHRAWGVLQENWVSNVGKMKTGISKLDELLGGGFNTKTFSVLGANSSIGKTTLALQIACNVAKTGRSVLFFSLEMSEAEVISKIISREIREQESNKNKWLTTDNIFSCEPQTQNYIYSFIHQEANKWLNNLFIKTFKEPISVDEIDKVIAEHKDAIGFYPLVIIDYVHIIKPEEKTRDERQNITQIITKLKKSSVNNEAHIMGIIPFNRASVVASLHAGRETSTIEYTADYFIGLDLKGIKEDSKQADKETALKGVDGKREVTLHLLKNRNGAVGKVDLIFETRYNLFKQG